MNRSVSVGMAAGALALLGAVSLCWPAVGITVALVAAMAAGAVAVLQRPLRGVLFALALYPFFPLLRALVIARFPTAIFGLRFWPEFVLALVFAGLLLRAIVSRRRFALRSDDVPALLYLLLCLYGMVLSAIGQHPLFVVYGFHVVAFPCLFYFAVRWASPDDAECARLLRWFVASFLVLALASLADYALRFEAVAQLANAARPEVAEFGGGKKDPILYWKTYSRMQSLLFEENVWGTLSRLVSLWSLAWLVLRRDALRAWLPLWGLSTLCLLLSVSRGSVVAWIVGIVVLLLFRRRYSGRITASLTAASLAVGALLVYASADPRVTTWLTLFGQIGFGTEQLAQDRAHQWRDGWRVFLSNPSGTGIGTIGYGASLTGRTLTLVADGNWVSLAAEMGVPGLGLMALTLTGIGWTLWRYLGASADRTDQALGLTLIAFLCGMAVHAVVANAFEYPYILPLFWTLLAIYVTRCERHARLDTDQAP